LVKKDANESKENKRKFEAKFIHNVIIGNATVKYKVKNPEQINYFKSFMLVIIKIQNTAKI